MKALLRILFLLIFGLTIASTTTWNFPGNVRNKALTKSDSINQAKEPKMDKIIKELNNRAYREIAKRPYLIQKYDKMFRSSKFLREQRAAFLEKYYGITPETQKRMKGQEKFFRMLRMQKKMTGNK